MDTSLQAELEKDAQEKIDKFMRKKNKEAITELKLSKRRQEKEVDIIPFFGSLDIKGLKIKETPFLLPVDFRDQVSSFILFVLLFLNFAITYTFFLLLLLRCLWANQVYAKPPPYHHIQSLQYDKLVRPKRREPTGESCRCHLVANAFSCGPLCLNRITYQECVGQANTAAGEKNKYWNCEMGIDCGNRMLGRKQYTRVKVQREVGKGFGLIAIDGVKCGKFLSWLKIAKRNQLNALFHNVSFFGYDFMLCFSMCCRKSCPRICWGGDQ